MKTLLSFLFIVVSIRPALAAPPILAEVEVQLSQFADVPELHDRVMAVRQQMGKFQALLNEADSLSQHHQLEFDFIGQTHAYEFATPRQRQEILASQRRVRQLLDSLDCELIGTEGSSEYIITVADIAENARRRLVMQTGCVDSMALQQSLRDTFEVDGVLAHLWGHPYHLVIGIEDHDLNRLDYDVLVSVFRDSTLSDQERAGRYFFGLYLSRLRSELAVATMIVTMADLGYQRAAVVMGSAHTGEFRAILQRYRIVGNFHPAE